MAKRWRSTVGESDTPKSYLEVCSRGEERGEKCQEMKKDEKKKGEEIEIIHPNRTCMQKGSIAGASFTHWNRKMTGSRGKEELKMD